MIRFNSKSFTFKQTTSWAVLALYLCALTITTVHTHQHYTEPHHASVTIEAPECDSCSVDSSNHACSICHLAQSFQFDLASPVTITQADFESAPLLTADHLPNHSYLSSRNPRAPPAVS